MTDTQPAGIPAADRAAILEYTIRRREWAAAVRWVASRHESRPAAAGWRILADRIESGALTPWADTPEPSTPPAAPSGERRAAAGPTPGTLDGPPSLGDQMTAALRRQREHAAASHAVDRTGWTRRQWVADAERLMGDVDGSVMDLVNGHVMALLGELAEVSGEAEQLGDLRAKLAAADTEVDELRRLASPAAGRVLDAARAVAGLEIDWEDRRLVAAAHRELRAAVDACARPTTGGETEQYEAVRDHADQQLRATATYQTGLPSGLKVGRPGRDHAAEPAPEPAGGADTTACADDTSAQVTPQNGTDIEPDSGPGWQRDYVAWMLDHLMAGTLGTGLQGSSADQLRALLTDRDHWAKVSGKWADETIAARNDADAARTQAARLHDLAERRFQALERVSAERDRFRYDSQRWARAAAEHDTAHADVERLRAELVEVTADRDQRQRLIDTYIAVHRDFEAKLRRLRAELATARRDAAADTLDWAARWHDRPDYSDIDVADRFRAWAAEIRSGTRPVPGSPEPGTDGGEEQE